MKPSESKTTTKITWLRSFATWLLTPLVHLLTRIDIQGLHNLPVNGAAVLACNHISMYDAFILQVCLPRAIFFMSKVENFKNPLIRVLMEQLGSFPVERGVSDRGALHHALQVLAAGEVLGMFPEGTRTHGNGLTEAKTGTAHLAMRANSPIIPVVLQGTENILKTPFKKAEVTLKVLPTIWAMQQEKAIDLTTRLMKLIAAELPVSQRGVYSD